MTKKILVCISGGGAIQLEAATGALLALERQGLFDGADLSYRACSGGAPVAALHAAGIPASEIASLIRSVPMKNLIKLGFFRRRFDAEGILELLKSKLPGRPLTNCRVAVTRARDMKPCMADATPTTVVASLSIPGVFRPQKINGEEYSDGGVYNLIPTPAIPDIPRYDHIYILPAPSGDDVDAGGFGELRKLLASAAGLLDREITQIYEDGWDRLKNVTVIRPDTPREAADRSVIEALLDWSPGNCMIDHAYIYANNLLTSRKTSP